MDHWDQLEKQAAYLINQCLYNLAWQLTVLLKNYSQNFLYVTSLGTNSGRDYFLWSAYLITFSATGTT
uniref:Uncharacterized protein n=1 Tax=Picea glauca TaxID=3330 RepID=A0A101LTN0_PICGL|nr:hypothetical protein ABT39_MTgene3612 [Picea glauca]KUM45154.1 hypothetical protein ABT39_MTgene3627 [Picea glauca]KUM51061.1 hypothetical protein ABT39_MTgene907 [Picea glauca]